LTSWPFSIAALANCHALSQAWCVYGPALTINANFISLL
jgi:hypothetical protein